jgi:hypothetical protein
MKGKKNGISGKSKIRWIILPIKKGNEINRFPLVIRCITNELIITNNKVWEIPLPEPIFRNISVLSMISGIKAPIIKANLLNEYLRVIKGISKISRGSAT